MLRFDAYASEHNAKRNFVMSLKGFSQSLFTYFLTPALVLTALPTYAASTCKGLDEAACKQSASCNWVSSYTTKNGNTVSAYCRSAGSKARQGQHLQEGKGSQSDHNDRANAGANTITRILEERNG
jgi:hypothetical protein